MQGALEYSLPLKKISSGLDSLYLWGRVIALNGRDYIVAEGFNHGMYYKNTVHVQLKHFFSQDGVNWADLEDITAEDAAICAKLNTQFTGDAAMIYQVRRSDSAPTLCLHCADSVPSLCRLCADCANI